MDGIMDDYAVTSGPAWQPSHPGEILREDVFPALEMTVSAIADKLGISRQMLHGILSEKYAVTPEMALRLGKLCGNGPDFWLAMQQAHDLWAARHEIEGELERIPTLNR
jgi:addiction module HigA family antidote